MKIRFGLSGLKTKLIKNLNLLFLPISAFYGEFLLFGFNEGNRIFSVSLLRIFLFSMALGFGLQLILDLIPNVKLRRGLTITAISFGTVYTCVEYCCKEFFKTYFSFAYMGEMAGGVVGEFFGNIISCIISGLPFILTEAVDPSDEYKAEKFAEYMGSLDEKGKTELYTTMLSKPSRETIDKTVELYLKEYGTREKMEELAATAFGMNVEAIRSYLEAYTDEQLTEIMKEQIEQMVISQTETQAEEAVREIMNTPSDEEATQIAQQILSQVTDTQMLIGMITQDWLENTTMDANTIALYLMGLSPDELNNAALSVAKKSAADYYAQMVTDEIRYKKAAEAFDAQFGGEKDTAVLAQWYDDFMPSVVSNLTYDETLKEIGVANINSPDEINIYATSFENKDKISEIIADYNETADEENKIKYTDYVAMLMSGITDIINAISYGLIAFVSISLVVSSIMIGIITYISVLERTKEIGILRSIGASKRDISLVFNAETLIVGFAAGFIGITVSLLACIPINLILHALTGITEINAFLMPVQCIVLVSISMILTLI